MTEDISVCRLVDKKLSCRYKEVEFYILPSKEETTPELLAAAFDALIIKLDEEKEKEIKEAIEFELIKRKEKEALDW